jgi:hypothetical protein
MIERLPFALRLGPDVHGQADAIQRELIYLLEDVELTYRIATETGVSDWSTVRLDDHLRAATLAEAISTIAT